MVVSTASTHTCTHARKKLPTQIHTQAHSQAHTHAHTHKHTHTYTYTHKHAYAGPHQLFSFWPHESRGGSKGREGGCSCCCHKESWISRAATGKEEEGQVVCRGGEWV